MVELSTQGGARGSCLALALGLPAAAPLGLIREEAAFCRFTNLQIPLSRE